MRSGDHGRILSKVPWVVAWAKVQAVNCYIYDSYRGLFNLRLQPKTPKTGGERIEIGLPPALADCAARGAPQNLAISLACSRARGHGAVGQFLHPAQQPARAAGPQWSEYPAAPAGA